MVVNLPFEDFLGDFDTKLLESFLICVGLVFIILYAVMVSLSQFRVSCNCALART